MHTHARLPALLVAALLAVLPAWAADAPDALTAAREAAEAAGAALLAPEDYAAALKAVGAGPPADPAAAARAVEAFNSAGTRARGAASRFAPALAARERAATAEAFRFATAEWQATEATLGKLVRRYARRDDAELAAEVAPLAARYGDVELAALRNRYLAPARAALAEADTARAERFAPRSRASAVALLAEADAALAANRAEPAAAEPAVAAATAAAGAAARMAREVERVARDERTVEDLALDYEAVLARAVQAAGLDPVPVTGDPAAADALVAGAAALRERLTTTTGELAERSRLIASLEDEIRELDARLGGAAAERDRLVRRAERETRTREQTAAAAALLAGSRAQVVGEGGGVLIRLTGLEFGRGGEPARSTRTRLGEVAGAIALFPGATIAVEGHTDATGSAEANQRASELRAEAVARELEVALKLAPGRIGHAGYGKARPVADNDTAAGRALNRRIDIRLTLPPA